MYSPHSSLTPKLPSSVISILLAFICFYLANGFDIVNPLNISWLCCGDLAQHYLGWAFFRHSSWQIPPGLNPNFGMELGSSIVYADAIPLVAILLKPISNYLPETFQFLGLWALGCFVLQGALAWNLIGLKTQDRVIQSCGVILFIFNPVFLSWPEQALSAHFLVLIGVYLCLTPYQGKHIAYWFILLWATTLIHFYILAMVGILFLANLIDFSLIQNRVSRIKTLVIFFIAISGIIFFAWLAGYFAIDTQHAITNNYGKWKINVLGLFDPYGWSYIIPSLPKTKLPGIADFDFEINFLEGNNFLGLGNIFLLLTSLYFLLSRKLKFSFHLDHQYGFIGAIIFLCLFSITHQISFGPYNFTIPLPEKLIALGSILRGAGRMFWAVYYLILLILIWQISSFSRKKWGRAILIIAVLLQVVDTSSHWLKRREMIVKLANDHGPKILSDRLWSLWGMQYKNLVRSPWDYSGPHSQYPFEWEIWAHYAAHHRMATNATYLSRMDDMQLSNLKNRFHKSVASGDYDSNTLYILKDEEVVPALAHINPHKDLFVRVNNFNVLASDGVGCKECSAEIQELGVFNFVPKPKLGETIIFSRAGKKLLPFVLLSGWAYPESWGVWAVGPRAQLNLPLPLNTGLANKTAGIAPKVPRELILDLRALVNARQTEQTIQMSVNGQSPVSYVLTQDAHNRIAIALSPKVLADGFVSLSFDLPTAKRPKDIGMGSDDRLLSIGLISAMYL